jgi:uncharacterized membrane protein SirB2
MGTLYIHTYKVTIPIIGSFASRKYKKSTAHKHTEKQHSQINAVVCLLKARKVAPEKLPLLSNGCANT